MKPKIYLIILFLLPLTVFSQITIRGKIIRTENTEAIIGASISIKGTTRGTLSNLNGSYSLGVNKTSGTIILLVKFIGFKDIEKEITLNGANIVQNFELISNDLQLPDVIVSARRVEEFLQKVPIATSVISANDIERRSVYSTIEALNNVPNLMTDSWVASQPTFSIRGLASNFDNVGFESTVALYIDDVYYSRGFAFNSTLFDIERVEVLRGPQGTLFGKNTVGGVINVISETPEFNHHSQAEINVGNYGFTQFRGKYNTILLKDKLALRLTGAFTSRNGYIKDLNSANAAQNKTLFGGIRGSILYKPSNKTTVTGRFFWGQDGKGENSFVYGSAENEDPLGIPTDTYKSTNNNVANTFERNQLGASVKVESSIQQNNITLITALNSSKDVYFGDNDITKLDVSSWGRTQKLSNFSQEFRISSPRDKQFSYVGGVYFLSENISGRDSLELGKDFLPFGEKLLERKLGNFPNYIETATTNSQINSISSAIYFSGNYKIDKKSSINAGIRLTSENKKLLYYQPLTYFENNGVAIGGIDYYAVELGSKNKQIEKKTNDFALSGDFSYNYEYNPFMMSYVKYSRGFKGAGYNTSVSGDATGAGLVFKPEYVNSFEIGLKNKLNDRTKINAAIFYVDYTNKQEILDKGYSIEVANAKKTNGWGAEVEFSGMVNKFRVDISSGVIGLRYREFIFGDEDYSGNKLLKAPNMTFSIAPQYSILLKDKYKILLNANINYTGKAYNDISNYELIARRAATIVNARIALMPNNGKWSVALWGKNLTNQRYIQHGFEYEWGNQISWSRPTYVGVEMYLNFF